MLPVLVFALVLGTGAFALPQASPLTQNSTVSETSVASEPTETSKGKVHGESTAEGWGETMGRDDDPPPVTFTCEGGCWIVTLHLETTATGFEQMVTSAGWETIKASQGAKFDLIVTSTPSVVDIHTEIEATAQQGAERPGETPNIPTRSGDGGSGSVTKLPQATSTEDTLLLDIISHIGTTTPPSPTNSESDPSDNSVLTPIESEPSNNSESAQTNADLQLQQSTESNSDQTAAPLEATPAVTVGGLITIGSTILTLTPGLSSVVGDGTTATFVAISTDNVGQTLITVSSSGTAMTATITNAPVTITKPRSGFDANITAAASPGNIDGTNTGSAAARTSSKGAAASGRRDMRHWLYAGMGLAGLGLAVG